NTAYRSSEPRRASSSASTPSRRSAKSGTRPFSPLPKKLVGSCSSAARLGRAFAATLCRSPMKITDVEAIYLRLPQVKEQCDSGQDALIVKVHTDAGITGIGEVDSNPMAVKGAIEGPFSHTTASELRELVIGEDPFET